MASFVTLRNVAESAGVSVGTASQAINNRPNVSPETRARVLEAAIALGYQVRAPAARPSENPLSSIGMLVMHDVGMEIEPSVFYVHIQSGVENECRKRGISLMFSTIDVDQKKRPVEWPAIIRDQHVEGLVILGVFLEDEIEQFQKHISMPVVLIDGFAPSLPFDSINIENIEGAYSGVDYLIKQGHRNIGLIGWHAETHPSIQERKEGYLKALRDNGITETFIEPCTLTRSSASEAFRRMKQKNPQVSAIFTCNDDIAIGIYHTAREMNIRLPEDLSIVGFDDIDLSRAILPALTTVHVFKPWMGMIGVRHLIDRVQNPDQPRLSTRVNTHLIVRDSVAPYLARS
jgi:DNA-binding LacI/PurR family transcriptional regulator